MFTITFQQLIHKPHMHHTICHTISSRIIAIASHPQTTLAIYWKPSCFITDMAKPTGYGLSETQEPQRTLCLPHIHLTHPLTNHTPQRNIWPPYHTTTTHQCQTTPVYRHRTKIQNTQKLSQLQLMTDTYQTIIWKPHIRHCHQGMDLHTTKISGDRNTSTNNSKVEDTFIKQHLGFDKDPQTINNSTAKTILGTSTGTQL